MAIQANALPPSLVAELNEMKRRLAALERKPRLGSVNERMPWSTYDTAVVDGPAGGTGFSTWGVIGSTGLNQPVLICGIPFAIPQGASGALDVSVTVWLRDLVTGGKSAEITLTKASDHPTVPGRTRLITWSWLHPQPIGFADREAWKAFSVDYRVNTRVTDGGVSKTVELGAAILCNGVAAGTFVEERSDGNPRIAGALTPTDGSPITWTG